MSRHLERPIPKSPSHSPTWAVSILIKGATSKQSRSCSVPCIFASRRSVQSICRSLSPSMTWATSTASKAVIRRRSRFTSVLSLFENRYWAVSILKLPFRSMGWQPCIENRGTTSRRKHSTGAPLLFENSDEVPSILKWLKHFMSWRACMNCGASHKRHWHTTSRRLPFENSDWARRIPTHEPRAHATPTSYEHVGGQRKPLFWRKRPPGKPQLERHAPLAQLLSSNPPQSAQKCTSADTKLRTGRSPIWIAVFARWLVRFSRDSTMISLLPLCTREPDASTECPQTDAQPLQHSVKDAQLIKAESISIKTSTRTTPAVNTPKRYAK